MAREADEPARAVAERVARESYGRLVAFLSARTRDVASAEDALADAFASALAHWPVSGVPDQPEAWLLAVARRRLIDMMRRRQTGREGEAHLRLIAEEIEAAAGDASIPDRRLQLMFACAHPAIDESVRAPLILQTILGFDAARIAEAFLMPAAAMSQRLVRAKQKIRLAGIPLRLPEAADMRERLDAVLDAVYAAYAEGWADATGADARRRSLAEEGLWLGRLLVQLLPDEPEPLGLLALMLYAEARRSARRSATGGYVPLSEQDTSLWDTDLIAEAEALLRRASAAGPTGRYQLEAAVQSAHLVRRVTGAADWRAIVGLYEALEAITSSPVVTLNRAVALAEVEGPAAGVRLLDTLASDKRLATYQPYWAARADLLLRYGDHAEAAQAYDRAIALEPDPAVRHFLEQRRASIAAN